MSSKRVRQLLSSKGNKAQAVYSVAPTDTVYHALETMAEHNVGALVVLENGKLAGVVSERDYARKVILKGLASRDVQVAELMTREVITVTPDDTIATCMKHMNERNIRHLPVLENEQVVGVVSINDVVATIMKDQAFEIEQLQGYISGTVG